MALPLHLIVTRYLNFECKCSIIQAREFHKLFHPKISSKTFVDILMEPKVNKIAWLGQFFLNAPSRNYADVLVQD